MDDDFFDSRTRREPHAERSSQHRSQVEPAKGKIEQRERGKRKQRGQRVERKKHPGSVTIQFPPPPPFSPPQLSGLPSFSFGCLFFFLCAFPAYGCPHYLSSWCLYDTIPRRVTPPIRHEDQT
ncbi:hypothetical protein BDV12DRAFT_24115 [Aspergillus spectabilis]